MRIGIFFGGKSREREVSFAGGRTVYDLLDKTLFSPVPIFVDGNGKFILLEWEYLYKGTIRDFFPSNYQSENGFQYYIESLYSKDDDYQDEIEKIGEEIFPTDFTNLFDFAFLTLHGPSGEDGYIQGLLSYYEIPFSGSGVLPSSIGIDKSIQKKFFEQNGLPTAQYISIKREDWLIGDKKALIGSIKKKFKEKCVVKSASQGSSIGVTILNTLSNDSIKAAIDKSFFIKEVFQVDWKKLNHTEKRSLIQVISDINSGIGLPIYSGTNVINNPDELLYYIDSELHTNECVILESIQTEHTVLVEEFISGKEFSCIVLENEKGLPIALPPTEIIKKGDIFNYRAKYLPGISRKITPMQTDEKILTQIRKSCRDLYQKMGFEVYARIDGMLTDDGKIFLNDPNTTSGMMPSSFFFHQAAEIGLSPKNLITYIIYRSLQVRKETGYNYFTLQLLLSELNNKLSEKQSSQTKLKRIGVILGGNSSERHISVESGRNVIEKLSSMGSYDVNALFLDNPDKDAFYIYQLPIQILLKDNADDIRDEVKNYKEEKVIGEIRREAKSILDIFGTEATGFEPIQIPFNELNNHFDFIFIALHGRPGEDGSIQRELLKLKIPFNGSGVVSSQTTIDKYLTNEILSQKGFLTPKHILIEKDNFLGNPDYYLSIIKSDISYPLIAKPSDDGCSSAVKKIDSEEAFLKYAKVLFRNNEELTIDDLENLQLQHGEEFPKKTFFVVEELVTKDLASHFLEITGGMLTHFSNEGLLQYEVFNPSEALAGKGILSLEEKFLAGEGQNITPSRFHKNPVKNKEINDFVKKELSKAAKILKVEGYCRIDAFVRVYEDKNPEVIFIEVNSLPGLTPATCIFHQASINGYKPSAFLERIIEFGEERNKKQTIEKVAL